MAIGILQITISMIIIALILLQERSSGLSGIFGGETGGFYRTRRGFERIIFWSTICLSALFVILSVIQLL